MKNLQTSIKNGQFNSVYLLTGPETYLRKQYTGKLREALAGSDTMNVAVFRGQTPDIAAIRDLAETLPFFAPRRIIIIEDSGLFDIKATAGEPLINMMEALPETTFLIFSEEVVDKRGRLFKAIKKLGQVAEFPIQGEDVLAKWVLSLAKTDGVNISPRDISKFLSITGTEMLKIKSEWDKLVSYAGDARDITGLHIDAICSRTVEDRVFDMIDAMSSQNPQLAFKLYEDLLALNTPAMKILFLLIRHFRLLYKGALCRKEGLSKDAIASNLGVRPFFVGKYMEQAGRYGLKRLQRALEDCANTENDIKTGKIKDITGIELLIAAYSV